MPTYSEKVMDHFMNPRNVGEIPDADGVGTVGNPVCGDMMAFYVKVDDEGHVADVKFKTFGCGAAIAVSSMVSEMAKGMSLEEAKADKQGRSQRVGRLAPQQDALLQVGSRCSAQGHRGLRIPEPRSPGACQDKGQDRTCGKGDALYVPLLS